MCMMYMASMVSTSNNVPKMNERFAGLKQVSLFFLTRLLVTIPSYYLVTSCQSRSSHRMRHLRQAAGGSASSSSALALSLGSLFKARRTT